MTGVLPLSISYHLGNQADGHTVLSPFSLYFYIIIISHPYFLIYTKQPKKTECKETEKMVGRLEGKNAIITGAAGYGIILLQMKRIR